MRQGDINNQKQQGATILEFVVVALVFFVMLIAICAGGNLYYTHNALLESTRRGARYGALQAAASPTGTPHVTPSDQACDTTSPSLTNIKNYTMYGNTAGTGTKLAPGLTADNICVNYSALPSDPSLNPGFGVGQGAISVSIINYDFHFVVPLMNATIRMPPYKTTVAGESAGACPPGGC
jgi:TadE-like protein